MSFVETELPSKECDVVLTAELRGCNRAVYSPTFTRNAENFESVEENL